MINKRRIGTVPESTKYIVQNILFQWLSLGANITMIWALTRFLAALATHTAPLALWGRTLFIAAAAVAVKFVCALGTSRASFRSGKAVKLTLRRLIYEKLLRLGSFYQESVQTSEVVQVAVEGAEQLKTYFGSYLPQFFYSMLAAL